MRIVSLLPSATEISCALGLEQDLVGVTHECDYPPFVKRLPKVTDTLIPHDATSGEIDQLVRERLKTNRALYTLDMPTLTMLKPDLLVTQALCDVCAVAEAEVSAAACSLPGHPRVLNLEPMSLEDVFRTLLVVGGATGRGERALHVVASLRQRVGMVAGRTAEIAPESRPRVAFHLHVTWDPNYAAAYAAQYGTDVWTTTVPREVYDRIFNTPWRWPQQPIIQIPYRLENMWPNFFNGWEKL